MQLQRYAERQTFKKYSGGLILKYQNPEPYKLNVRKILEMEQEYK
jgi:hypothetical protein